MRSIVSSLLRYREIGVIISIIAMGIAFTVLNPQFLSLGSLASMVSLASELGIVAIGVSFLIIAGEFDLSVGSVFAASSMLMVWLLNSGVPFIAALLISLGLAAMIGLANAIITIKGGIPSFITTLGMMWFIRGVLLAVTGGFPVRLEVDVPELKIFSMPIYQELRISGLWFLILAVLFHFTLMWTAYGNWVQAVGGAPETARALGINVARVKTINFVLSSVMAALSGIIALSRFNVVEPVAGQGLELEAIASAVIGGCALTGGIGTIAGASLGAFLVGEIRVGLILAGAPAYWYIGFIGILLIVAGIINLRLIRRE
ncbi:MAG TPA: ABC transporter permease [Acidilobales archaeon]|nr:ABC transporter permease [Acidilobales archaeon]